jgi:diphthine-ammonia ligase
MYQTVGHEMVPLIAEAMELPLFRRTIAGASVNVEGSYTPTSGDEVEDLLALLEDVRQAHPGVQGVSVGAILSDYQRVRVEGVCARLGLTCCAFLWRRSQSELLDEMIACNLNAVIIKVICLL